MTPRNEVIRGLRIAAAAIVLALPCFHASADESAEALAAKADAILDRWDGDAKPLEEAGALIERAIAIEPGSARARGVQARQILYAGTTEEGIRPSALAKASAILFQATSELQPVDARTFALTARVWIKRKELKPYWALNNANKVDSSDPWVSYAWAELYASEGNTNKQTEFLEKAIAAGLASRTELRGAYELLLPQYVGNHERQKADATYAGLAALDPRDAVLPDGYARDLIVYFQDFQAGERVARDAIALSNSPHAHETLSLALYGQWAAAARDGKGPEVIESLYRKAQSHDPGGRMLPTCLSGWPPLEFVYARLAQKDIKTRDMHQC